jgi:hypothetical protein
MLCPIVHRSSIGDDDLEKALVDFTTGTDSILRLGS